MKDNLIFETDWFTVGQADNYRVPGYVIVQSKVECFDMSSFTPGQIADFVKCLADAEAMVQQLIQPERIYLLKFGEQNPRVHFHVFPRTRTIAEAYAAEVQDDEPYSGARIVDWVWCHHESLDFTDAQIRGFVENGRKVIQGRRQVDGVRREP